MDFVTDLHYKTHLYRSETSNAGQGTIYFFLNHTTSPWYLQSVVQGRVVLSVLFDSVRVFCFARSMHHTLGGAERRNGEENEKEIKRKRERREEEKQEYKETDDKKERGP
jgi:hypothetical protein